MSEFTHIFEQRFFERIKSGGKKQPLGPLKSLHHRNQVTEMFSNFSNSALSSALIIPCRILFQRC